MCFLACTAASSMRGCSKGGVAIQTASISDEASSISNSVNFFVPWLLMMVSDLSNWSGNLSQSAVIRARGSAFTMLASYEPRPPHPISPTEIWELACDPRTACGATMVNVAAAPVRNLRRDVASFMTCLDALHYKPLQSPKLPPPGYMTQ